MGEPSPPPIREADPVAEALDLLHRLNGMRTADGVRLPSAYSVEGFEPWWFAQESLMWDLLVPYAEHRRLVRDLLAGRAAAGAETPRPVRELFRRLGEPLAAGAPALRPRRFARRLLRAASRLGLLGVSLACALWLRLARRDTLIYILDQVSPGLRHDFRLDGIYRELRRRGYRFAECVHLRGAAECYRQAWRNLLRRRRPVVFLEVLSRPGAPRPAAREIPRVAPEPAAGDDPDAQFLLRVARVALDRARRVAAEIPRLRRMLRLLGARRIVALDDSRHVNGLVAAARLEGIPSLGYMHGLFNRYHPALLCRGLGAARRHGFDLLGVWSAYFQRRLLEGELYDREHTFVTGPIRAARGEALERSERSERSRHPHRRGDTLLRILVISEPRARQREVARYVEKLRDAGNFRVSIKVRPGEEVPHFRPAGGEAGGALEVLRSDTVYEAFERCDVAVGTYSSVLYEAVLALVPVVVLRTTFSYGHEIAEDGLAELASSPEVVVETVERAAGLDRRELLRRRQVLWGEAPPDGARRLFDAAETRLWSAPESARARTGR